MEQKLPIANRPALQIHSLTPHNLLLILSFLDTHTINALIQADETPASKKSAFCSLARNLSFVQRYLNKTDRSIYMPFYSQPLFIKMEKQQLSHICCHSTPVLNFLSTSFKGLFTLLQNCIGDFQMNTEVIESITESLTDPELPFPKLRKQNVGVHCNSAFQYFLVDRLFPNGEQEGLEELFEEFSKYLSQKWDLSQQNQQKEVRIIEEVFSSWFKVGYQNYQNYLIPHNANHNLVVAIVALLDLLVDCISFYIESIQDPLYAFIEFNMRYCIFRNVILSLQQKLGFLFKNYSSFCAGIMDAKNDVSRCGPRQMTIWHCGLSKWYIYMQRHHQTYFRSFFYLVKKLSLQAIKQQNLQKIKQDKTFIELHNVLQFNEVDLLDREETLQAFSPIQDIFDEKRQLYSQLIKEYVQYVVDISINQYSVHWCGHSGHVLHIPYQEFQSLLLEEFRGYFFKIVQIAKQVSNPLLAIDNTIRSIISQLDREYLKPVTLRKVVQFTQSVVVETIGVEQYEESELYQTLNELAIQFSQKDSRIFHFNETLKLKNDGNEKYSIVLESEDFNKALKTSASTTASRNSNTLHINITLSSYDSIVEQDFS